MHTNYLNMNAIIVTGLWDLGRGKMGEGWSRSYDDYLKKFEELLKIDNDMIIYGDEQLEYFVSERREKHNTQFIRRDLDWFRYQSHYPMIQKIREKEEWLSQAGWLRDSTQAKLEMYNPVVMSKVFLLNDAVISNSLGSDTEENYYFWLDAGITNTVHPGYFTHDQVLHRLPLNNSKILFVSFPYKAENEIHGFNYEEFKKITSKNTQYVVRGGFFGGNKRNISWLNETYYRLLNSTLGRGLMGTEESIFTIISELYPYKVDRYRIEENGLLSTFFENVKNRTTKNVKHNSLSVYILSYNSPLQFEKTARSIKYYANSSFKNAKKILINNSTKESTFEQYDKFCKDYDIEEIHKDNIGICGGRQFAAEHFDQSTSEYMVFFEDDMCLYSEPQHGYFNRYVERIFEKSMEIMTKENLDYLKLTFKEFFGDNIKQWAWMNLPEDKMKDYFPDYGGHRMIDLMPDTIYDKIGKYEDLMYATGEPHYCNWPVLFNKEGNRKVFLDTKWAHPYEQTWMSHVFQLMRAGTIKAGVLLLDSVVHDRFQHYPASERIESV